jgi:hypothetical protein
MATPKPPDTAYPETTLIGKSVVTKGELSCDEDLYIDGQAEGTIDPRTPPDHRAERTRESQRDRVRYSRAG